MRRGGVFSACGPIVLFLGNFSDWGTPITMMRSTPPCEFHSTAFMCKWRYRSYIMLTAVVIHCSSKDLRILIQRGNPIAPEGGNLTDATKLVTRNTSMPQAMMHIGMSMQVPGLQPHERFRSAELSAKPFL